MRVERLEVADFRNHSEAGLDLEPGVNVLTGANGVGKTSLLEAIAYASTLSSHRTGADAHLVRVGAAAAVIRARAVREGRTILVELELRPGAGVRGRLNGAPVARSRELLGVVRAVSFAPEDVELVRGDPDERRRFLDGLLVQRRPGHLATRQEYERVLKQRNALLKSANGRVPAGEGLAILDVWDEKLAAVGGEVWARRLEVVELLAPRVDAAYREVAAVDRLQHVRLRYASSVREDPERCDPADLAMLLRERLGADRRREIERGLTLTGPHRDDLITDIGALPARTHASQGEAWALALSLRLGSRRLLAEDGDEPVLLLDDVFAELDRGRRDRVVSLATEAEQAVVTAAVPEELPAGLGGARFGVRPGSVQKENPGGMSPSALPPAEAATGGR